MSLELRKAAQNQIDQQAESDRGAHSKDGPPHSIGMAHQETPLKNRYRIRIIVPTMIALRQLRNT